MGESSRPIDTYKRFVCAGVIGVILLGMTGCGNSDPVEMPDVTASQLDVALSDIKRAGFEDEVEVLGGGTFGVVDESAWTVCKQEPSAGATVGEAPRLTVDRECGGGDGSTGSDESPPAEEDTNPKPAESGSGDQGDQPPSEKFVMPALVGQNLQDAQDRLQSLGSYLLTQTDGTGMERFQMLDSGWKVCGQRPRAGKRVSVDRMVELIAVKLHEPCS